ncbi:hypothetical protein [Vibrio mexicanus]|nr:hypothetical protein [Vibrio mexicanus]
MKHFIVNQTVCASVDSASAMAGAFGASTISADRKPTATKK